MTLVARFGADVSMAKLLSRRVVNAGFEKHGDISAPCGAHDADLVLSASAASRNGGPMTLTVA